MEVNEILAHETDVLSLEVEMQQKVRERRLGARPATMWSCCASSALKVLASIMSPQASDGDEEIEEYTHRVHALRVDDEIWQSSRARHRLDQAAS